MVTLKDLAARTGFSQTTISLVLNKKRRASHISPETKTIIREAARVLRYRPNFFARSLRASLSYMVGLLIYDIVDPYCAPLVRTIETILIPHGYSLLISDLNCDRSRYGEALNNLVDRRVDGIIIMANELPFDIEMLYRGCNCPVVVIGRICRLHSIPYFVGEEEEGGAMSARHLVELGHRRIGFIWDQGESEWSQLRWKGVLHAMEGARLSPQPHRIVRTPNDSSDAGYHAMRQLLTTRDRVTAICAIDDQVAFGAIRAIFDAGLRVPEDISVIGFDDLAVSRYFNPPLTTIAQPLGKLAEMASEALLGRMKGRKGPSSCRLPPMLVKRRSTQLLLKARAQKP